MALLEGYIAKWNKYPKDEVKIRVARPHILSPSKKILKRYKDGELDWKSYDTLYRLYLGGSYDKYRAMREIYELSKKEDVRLICYEKDPNMCHRSILMEIINNLDNYYDPPNYRERYELEKSDLGGRMSNILFKLKDKTRIYKFDLVDLVDDGAKSEMYYVRKRILEGAKVDVIIKGLEVGE